MSPQVDINEDKELKETSTKTSRKTFLLPAWDFPAKPLFVSVDERRWLVTRYQ